MGARLLLVVSGAGGDWHQGFPHDGARDARTHSDDDDDGGAGQQLVSVHKWPQCKCVTTVVNQMITKVRKIHTQWFSSSGHRDR